MRHSALGKLFTLDGGFTGDDGRQSVTIPGTYQPAKMGRREWTPGNPVGNVAIIEIPCHALSQAPKKLFHIF